MIKCASSILFIDSPWYHVIVPALNIQYIDLSQRLKYGCYSILASIKLLPSQEEASASTCLNVLFFLMGNFGPKYRDWNQQLEVLFHFIHPLRFCSNVYCWEPPLIFLIYINHYIIEYIKNKINPSKRQLHQLFGQ